ncbi:MAG: hypothetical protein QW244_01295 [Candidatus Pacearchaeota archaeon]
MKKNKKLIFDTNWIINCAKYKYYELFFNLINKYECFVLDRTIRELEKAGIYKPQVKFLLEQLEKKAKIIKAKRYVDKEILKLAKEKAVEAVATFDKELIKKLKKANEMIEIIKSKSE